MARKKYSSVRTELWGVFYVGDAWGVFRTLKAAFDEKTDAAAWAKQYSAAHYGCTMMVEEIKVVVPSWDGLVPSPIEA